MRPRIEKRRASLAATQFIQTITRMPNGGCVFTEVKTHPCHCLSTIELRRAIIISSPLPEHNRFSLFSFGFPCYNHPKEGGDTMKSEEEYSPHHGRKSNQKLKPYLVMQYLLKHSDENHPVDSYNLCDYLEELGIDAERRSIYSDITEINKIMWMQEYGGTIEEATEAIEDESERAIAYSGKKDKRGFYVRRRPYEESEVRLLAECVYAAKFIPKRQADRLAEIACESVSNSQAADIKHDALVVDRAKTLNENTLNNIFTLRDAMAKQLDGEPHEPEKVSFKYLTHEIGNLEKPVVRRREYVVSPYYLIINDGNYYLLAFDDAKQDMRTYRVDRIKSIQRKGLPRDGENVFKKLDMNTYTQRVFSMFGGELKLVQLRFINPLLDTVMDRFSPAGGAVYSKVDNSHFMVTTRVEISDQFFSWLCGFGKRVKIETPEVAAAFVAYLDKIKELYESH